jgi:hypothetical protein
MARPVRLLLALAFVLGALLGPLGASYDVSAQDTASAVAAIVDVQDLGTLNPAFQDDVNTDTGNPTDVPDTIDNPVTDQPLDMDTLLAMWLVILGTISTFAISFINRFLPGVTPDDNMKRAVVALVFCLAVGVADTLVRGVLNPTNLTATFIIIFFSAVGFYKAWFQPAGLADKIETK